jgi:hypothetical protein
MIKIITNMPPHNSAIMRPLLDGMDKIEAFRRDVVAIVCEASEMTCGPTRVCPHEFSCILRPITVSGSLQASVGANRSTPYFRFLETKIRFLEMKICFLGNENSFPRIVGNKNSFPTYSIVTRPCVPPSQSCRNLRFSASGLSDFWRERHFQRAQSLNHE